MRMWQVQHRDNKHNLTRVTPFQMKIIKGVRFFKKKQGYQKIGNHMEKMGAPDPRWLYENGEPVPKEVCVKYNLEFAEDMKAEPEVEDLKPKEVVFPEEKAPKAPAKKRVKKEEQA
jgi:hypothetical protein